MVVVIGFVAELSTSSFAGDAAFAVRHDDVCTLLGWQLIALPETCADTHGSSVDVALLDPALGCLEVDWFAVLLRVRFPSKGIVCSVDVFFSFQVMMKERDFSTFSDCERRAIRNAVIKRAIVNSRRH